MGELSQSSSKRSRIIGPPWVFTLIVVVVAVVLWPFNGPSSSNYAGLGFTFLSLSIAAMTGIWCAIAKPWWRYGVGLLVTLINGVALLMRTGPSDDLMLFLLPLLIALPIASTLEIVKLRFGRFTQDVDADVDFQEGLQFGISHLMIVTAVVAALCAIGRAVAPLFDFVFQYRIVLSVAMIVSVLAVNTLVSTWALLGVSVRWRGLISLATAGLIIFLGSYYSPNGNIVLWAIMFGVVWLVTTILLILLRRDGYRFVSKRLESTAS